MTRQIFWLTYSEVIDLKIIHSGALQVNCECHQHHHHFESCLILLKHNTSIQKFNDLWDFGCSNHPLAIPSTYCQTNVFSLSINVVDCCKHGDSRIFENNMQLSIVHLFFKWRWECTIMFFIFVNNFATLIFSIKLLVFRNLRENIQFY